MSKILVVDDEADIVELLTDTLEMSGFEVESTSNGDKALDILETRAKEFDLGLFDVMMPRLSGTGLLKLMREKKIELPVIFLTAKDLLTSKIEGLQLGADDYITKPFDIRELTERVKAVLRRADSGAGDRVHSGAVSESNAAMGLQNSGTRTNTERILHVDDIEVDTFNRDVKRNGHQVDLTPNEFTILEILLIGVGDVVTKTELLQAIGYRSWEENFAVIDTHISALRKKLNKFGEEMIETKRGVGYIIRGGKK